MEIINIELTGTKARKALSKGYCSRIKAAAPMGAGKLYNYSDERCAATENGILTSFEAQLLGSLGLATREIIQIVNTCSSNGETLYRWGGSQKILAVEKLGHGASKQAYHFYEYGGNGDGFVLKYNRTNWYQTAEEARTYERLIKAGDDGLVSKIYRFDCHLKSAAHARVHIIEGEKCAMVIDGVLFCEYCRGVGQIDEKEYVRLSEKIGDCHSHNVGYNGAGCIVCIDYGI